jgi:hypothetical protein
MNDNSFFSIDRLVDFGLGMGVANQMVGVMNQYMHNMDIPGSIRSTAQSMPNIYYVALDSKPIGPLNDSEMSQLIMQKRVNKDTLAWMPGMTEWKTVENIPAILKIVALAPPPLPTR